ncbi:uncharacterized protein LOC120286826 [Eucalyptus grandis]|uniref:uncharacterized protein LOC120286826 n=1 Tax=Eucalyptus grandis TaxID=71139 RepID=UPI00192F0ADE|nr:uncharacterized protein LOC120286826 [Eucalyptus grandis]
MIISLSSIFTLRVLLLTSHVLLLSGISCSAKNNHLCAPSSCGEIRNISYPFRLKGDPKNCSSSRFELTCENNRTILYLYAGRYYVKSIHYGFYYNQYYFDGNITVVDDGLQKGNCSSLPRYPLMFSNFSYDGIYFPPYPLTYSNFSYDERYAREVAFMKCSQPIASSLYVDTRSYIEGYSADTPPYFSQMKVYSYAVQNLKAGDVKDSCTVTMMAYASDQISGQEGDQNGSLTYKDLHNKMTEGFNLTYGGFFRARAFRCRYLSFGYRMESCGDINFRKGLRLKDYATWARYYYAPHVGQSLALVLANYVAAKFVLGVLCVLILLIYKWMRRHQAIDANIKEFLQAHNNFLPIRYSYSDIKKITKNFKYKLGEGGYGSVYRGILRSGNEVAVKILNKSESNSQDFISEVATIGRIHHINVVQLVGFCFNYSKQALVYDFMPNGSLDKHISNKDGDDPLDYKKMYEISLGIARGIEYLHQ